MSVGTFLFCLSPDENNKRFNNIYLHFVILIRLFVQVYMNPIVRARLSQLDQQLSIGSRVGVIYARLFKYTQHTASLQRTIEPARSKAVLSIVYEIQKMYQGVIGYLTYGDVLI